MDRVSLSVERSLMNALGESRVRMDGCMKVFDRRLQRQAEAHFRNDVGRIGSDDMCPQQLSVLFSKEQLDEPIGLRCSLGFSKRLIGKLTRLIGNPLLLQIALRLTYRCNLRLSIGTAVERLYPVG